METVDREIGKIFAEDIRDKKRAGRGVYHRAERRGPKGGRVRLPSEKLTKRELEKMSGEVKETIMSKNEFYGLNVEQKKKIMGGWLKKYSRSEIAKIWGTSTSTVSSLAFRLGLAGVGIVSPAWMARQAKAQELKREPKLEARPEAKQELLTFTIGFAGKFDGGEIVERLLKLAEFLKTDGKYTVRLDLSEEF